MSWLGLVSSRFRGSNCKRRCLTGKCSLVPPTRCLAQRKVCTSCRNFKSVTGGAALTSGALTSGPGFRPPVVLQGNRVSSIVNAGNTPECAEVSWNLIRTNCPNQVSHGGLRKPILLRAARVNGGLLLPAARELAGQARGRTKSRRTKHVSQKPLHMALLNGQAVFCPHKGCLAERSTDRNKNNSRTKEDLDMAPGK